MAQYNAYLRSEEFHYQQPYYLSKVFKAVLEENIEKLNAIKFATEYSLNAGDDFGNTPLHVAVISNKLVSLDYLLAQDIVSVDAKNNFGQTPIFNACRTDKIEIAKKLIKSGACINIQDGQKNTPLHMSVCNPEITHILIKNGADIDSINFYQDTPLHDAITVENLETVCLLLYYNCDANVKNSEGNTPFMDALIYENPGIQTALFEYVDDFNVTTTDGDTILTLALTYHSEFIEEILSRGAKVNRRALESSLMINNPTVFETIWKRIPNVELENSSILDKFAYGMRRNNILKYFEIILENSDESLFEALAVCFNCQISFADLVEKCADNQGLEQLTKFICVLLQYNCHFLITTVFQIYYCFGYCDLFKYFLYIDSSVKYCKYEISFGWIIPKYIFSIKSDMKELCRELTFNKAKDATHRKAAFSSLEFSVDSSLVQLLNTYFSDDADFVILRKKVPVVPSLLQLARDKIRTYFVYKFDFCKPSQFYTFVNDLEIATVYKQIITLEKKIYNFDFR
ncbi:unnamed protein product [Psylliodes chrysocephalus]|uniref:PRANC domain-containing protein n=1 Tax=Psylliodes chrysocephalus TaxID=3402493 RepID=A0A9P0DC46_9CUCU|nr:unnamed protein product [Psylliodes chrysocephala]